MDRLQFSRVLNNLVKNAIEAMSANDHIRIASNDRKNGIEISVGNTGSYIPLSEQRQIFKSGYTSKKKGQGLGLAIVQKIVTAHGGTITCQSDHQNGTIFLIEILDQPILSVLTSNHYKFPKG